jgi:hypothetical protein
MKLICKERLNDVKSAASSARGINSVSPDVQRLLGPKTYEELEVLEKQIKRKLSSNEPIDVDYWDHLLRSLQTFKAKARLRKVSQAIVNNRLQILREHQEDEANQAHSRLKTFVEKLISSATDDTSGIRPLDPEPFLRLPAGDRGLNSLDERGFLGEVTQERQRIHRLGYVPAKKVIRDRPVARVPPPSRDNGSTTETFEVPLTLTAHVMEETSEAANAHFQREVARGVQENEEVFATEETVQATSNATAQSQLRKPKFYNRVQLGYEWNKYNQTHYDHDNPPPKVVQGYRFNIFYPNLIDKTKAPTYKIEREGGRKRGQTFAPAGEDDTCVIRFVAGPPYQDIAFRIVDKEWDYSAKRDRGFRSTFEHVCTNVLNSIDFEADLSSRECCLYTFSSRKCTIASEVILDEARLIGLPGSAGLRTCGTANSTSIRLPSNPIHRSNEIVRYLTIIARCVLLSPRPEERCQRWHGSMHSSSCRSAVCIFPSRETTLRYGDAVTQTGAKVPCVSASKR